MANFYSVLINLTSVGYDAGPFDILYSTDGGISFNTLQNNVPASSFTGTGYLVTNLPDDAELVQITSNGVCSNSIITQVDGYPTNCSGTTTSVTTIPCGGACSASCCVYYVEVINEDDLQFIDCLGNNSGSQKAYSSFTFCYDQSTGFIIAPGAQPPVIVDCDCTGYQQPNIDYSIEICDSNIQYNTILGVYNSNIFSVNSIFGVPLYCNVSGSSTSIAGSSLILTSTVSAQTNGYYYEVFNNNVFIYSASVSTNSTNIYATNMSLDDNWFIRIYDS